MPHKFHVGSLVVIDVEANCGHLSLGVGQSACDGNWADGLKGESVLVDIRRHGFFFLVDEVIVGMAGQNAVVLRKYDIDLGQVLPSATEANHDFGAGIHLGVFGNAPLFLKDADVRDYGCFLAVGQKQQANATGYE